NFNRADSNDLGSDWTHSIGFGGGVAGIVSNTVKKSEGIFAVAYRKGTFDDDQWAEATFSGGGVSWSGVALRCDATSSVVWQCSGSYIQLLVVNNGTRTGKGLITYPVVEGDVIRGEVIGTTYKVFINGTLAHSINNPSGANTSGNPGIMVEGYAMDNWSGGDNSSNGTDCDDTDNTVYPGAPELCDGKDNDCDAVIDNDITFTTYYADADGDSYGDVADAGTLFCSDPGVGFGLTNDDCNDEDAAINPGAIEIVGNGIDDDCNPATSDSSSDIDADGDGYTAIEGDCNDSDSAVNPGVTEVPYN
ncbi:putative metal-binding motif-containing protein, partial [Algibacter luteus]|uniref:putative metal-binding motif-containing protein n=1 Tax=Algibacter luteus TaxID=1178825 RepID=UPI001872D444